VAGLIITNGDSAADLLRLAGRTETILPWRDVLHEGPITATGLAECSRGRALYLAHRFRLPESEVAAELAERDALMYRHADFDTIALWFEHDLYDQLQLLQVLAFFAEVGRTDGLTLVQADDFLGAQTAQTILRFERQVRPVRPADLALASTVWAELAFQTPRLIADRVARAEASPLPYLLPALRRFLDELPSPQNGLGRTEQTILDLIDGGVTDAKALFATAIRQEEAAFIGDWSFFHLIEDLAFAEVPLIAGLAPPRQAEEEPRRVHEAELTLTMAGDDVREGGDDHVALNGLDRWWAGTRLLGRSVWRYDRDAQRLVPPGESGA
jgi:hypothetical protein